MNTAQACTPDEHTRRTAGPERHTNWSQLLKKKFRRGCKRSIKDENNKEHDDQENMQGKTSIPNIACDAMFCLWMKFNGWLKWIGGNLISGSLTKTKADSFGESYVLRRITYELSEMATNKPCEKATNKPCEKDLCFRHTEVNCIFFRNPADRFILLIYVS